MILQFTYHASEPFFRARKTWLCINQYQSKRGGAERERRFHMATAVAVESPVKISATKLLINNQWVNSASGKTFPTINPSTGDEICQISEADKPDVDRAVKAARAAFNGPWRKVSAAQRGV